MRSVLSLLAICMAILMIGCKGEGKSAGDLKEMDLMSHGMPIKIKVPTGAKVESSDMGIMKDVTIKADNNYSLQISSGVATTMDPSAIKSQQKSYVKDAAFFDEILEEDNNGFIYRKKISEDRINHDFRYIKIQGDLEYIFQTGLMGHFSLEDVQLMYASVK